MTAFKHSKHIRQYAPLFADYINAICPMLYLSHFKPYAKHAKIPYKTIYTALVNLRKQLREDPDVKIYAYIEMYNFRYHFSHTQRE